jgi:hypothetical protein
MRLAVTGESAPEVDSKPRLLWALLTAWSGPHSKSTGGEEPMKQGALEGEGRR